jgi:hypothetical protein
MPRIVKGENSDVSDLNHFPLFGIRLSRITPLSRIPASGRAVFQSETIYVLRDAGKARNRAFPVQFIIGLTELEVCLIAADDHRPLAMRNGDDSFRSSAPRQIQC